jgi:hypothetical protein
MCEQITEGSKNHPGNGDNSVKNLDPFHSIDEEGCSLSDGGVNPSVFTHCRNDMIPKKQFGIMEDPWRHMEITLR